MTNAGEIVNRIFSDRKMSVFIIVLALAARAIQLLFYLDSFFDTTFQVIATQNLADGHGVATAIVNATDLSTPVYQPLINWPPGYSFILYPFYTAFGHNYLIACFTVDMLAAAAIIFSTRKILSLLSIPVAYINLFTLLTGFFIYYFYYTGSTDSVGVAFFLLAISVMLRAVRNNNKWTTAAVLSGTFLFLCASVKYLFFPVVFVLPLFLFVYGYQNKSGAIKKAALLMFGIVAAGIGLLYFYQKSISGTGAYISSPGRGIYPEQLLRMHPLLPASFVTLNTLRKLPAAAQHDVLGIFRVIHLLAFAFIIFFIIREFIRSGFRNAALQKTFLLLAFVVSVAITVVLALLSLFVYREIIPPDRWWTYIEDSRYYGLADIMIHLSIFVLSWHYREKVSGFLKKLLIILPFLLIPEAIRGLSFTAIRVLNAGKEKYYWQQEKGFQEYAASLVQQKKDSLHAGKVVVTGSLYYAYYRTSLFQHIPVLEDLAALNNPASLKAKEPVILLGIIKESSKPGFLPFINYPKTELAGKYNGFYFYTLYVTPE